MPQPQAPQATNDPWAANQFARNAIIRGVTGTNGRRVGPAIKRAYPLNQGTGTFVPANTPQVTVTPQNVGLLLGFWVQIQLVVSNTSGQAIQLTDFGPLNAIAQFQFQDLQNNTRIQCPGWLIGFVNNCRERYTIFGASYVKATGTDSPINWGPNFANQISAPPTIPTGQSGTVTMWYWIPTAYSDEDLRGALYINVLNAITQLNIAFAGNGGTAPFGVTICAANAADNTQAVYFLNAAGGTLANVTQTSAVVNVWQVFYDQLPIDPKMGLLLPVMDLATVYEIKQTVQTALVANQDFPYQYSNYRDFLATYLIYNNNPAIATGRGNGNDINYFLLQTANFTNIFKKSPALLALETRNLLGSDMPPGCYYFPTRQRRISTTQYGNMQLVLNALTVNASAYELIGTEDFALQTTLSIAGSLSAS